MEETKNAFHWGPENPHPLSMMRTELVWGEIMEKNRKGPPPFLEMAVLETEAVVRNQKSEVRGQKSEVRGQKSEVRGSEVGGCEADEVPAVTVGSAELAEPTKGPNMMTMNPEILSNDGKPQFAVLPYEEFLQLQAALARAEGLETADPGLGGFHENLRATELARRQGVKPAADLEDLRWPYGAENWEGFEEAIDVWRHGKSEG
jgi:hypothetical protein